MESFQPLLVTEAVGYSGDGGAAVEASFNYPSSVAVDAVGDVYIADTRNIGTVSAWSIHKGVVITIAR